MKYLFSAFIASSFFFFSCSESSRTDQETDSLAVGDTEPEVVTIKTSNMDIQMADTLPAGYNHLVYENNSDMTHFLLFNKVPDTIGLQQYHSELTLPFQELMDATLEEREPEAVFPEWLGAMVNSGGVGLISPGQTAESYVNFPAGNYIVECYIKSDGKFHSTTGMLKQVTVVAGGDNTPPLPEPTASINVDSIGLSVAGGLPEKAGEVHFKVNYINTKLYPNFTRPDVHLVRLTDDVDADELFNYMDWSVPGGMVANSPAVFLGGVQEMPDGNVAYFTQTLTAGRYALIGEVPQPKTMGFYLEFEVGD